MSDASIEVRRPIHVEIFRLLSDAKWIIAVSIVMSLILYLPDQLRELYRIVFASPHWGPRVSTFLPICIIGLICWFTANQVCAASLARSGGSRVTSLGAFLLAPLLGALPVLAAAAGQYNSRPSGFTDADAALNVVGSPLENQDKLLALEVGRGLETGAQILVGSGILLFLAFLLLSKLLARRSDALNANVLGRRPFLLVVVLLIAGMTGAYVLFPLGLPRSLGVFGIIATFALCVAMFTLYFTLLTLRYRFPFIPLIVGAAVVLSVYDLNDNHQVRVLEPEAGAAKLSVTRPAAWAEFQKWHESRPDRGSYDEYPVYIVTAQGGGIYAAYQSALFLARLQDYCPAFRHHVFAISSVSGGSLGAATFASLLNAVAKIELPPPQQDGTPAGCPAIATFLRNDGMVPSAGAVAAGPLEQHVQRLLANDFLSPLVAATLFPDFLQRFLILPQSSFDRARALERAFELTMEELKVDGKPAFEQSFLAHWNPAGATPALLMNATDAGSGRRVLIAPFEISTGAAAVGRTGSLLHFPFGQPVHPPSSPIDKTPALDIRLSSAVGISARFPWMTPAATIPVADIPPSKLPKMRLVDGGYLDNSGVDTALDLIQSLADGMESIRDPADTGRRISGVGKTPFGTVRFSLIVLSGGDFPVRSSFALGETLEPIRTFLSTRESRAYVAIERANRTLQPMQLAKQQFGDKSITVQGNTVKTTSLVSRFYDLPLGWRLSDRTRQVIAWQSGRFWDCDPNEKFEPSVTGWPATDCIQLLIHHELSKSLGAGGEEAAYVAYARGIFNGKTKPRLNHQALIRCYRDKALKTMTVVQSRNLDALLSVWDENEQWEDDFWLAYVLGTIAHETANFRAKVERTTEAQANQRYGGRMGNTEPGDGWRYRGRGMIQLTGRTNFRNTGKTLGIDLEAIPKLMEVPEVSARGAVSFFFGGVNQARVRNAMKENPPNWTALRRIVNGGTQGLQDVRAKTEIFQACIAQAKMPAAVPAAPPEDDDYGNAAP